VEEEIEMRGKIIFCTLLIITIAFPIASATEWDSATFTLSLENTVVSKGDYTINVVEFDGYGMVALNISCNGLFIGNTVLMNNESNWYYLEKDRIRLKGINVTDQRILPMYGSVHSPQAEIVFATERSPEESGSMALSISTDKEEYLIDQQVTVTMKIRNIGEVNVDDIQLSIDPDGLMVQGNLLSGFGLNDGTYRSEEIKLRFPSTLHKGSYNISVNISWTDAHGTRDFLTESDTISITQPIEVYKSTTNEASQGQTVYTSISVENIQSRPVSVRLDDALPMFFTLIDGTVTDHKPVLNWEFILSPYERKVVSYQMIPEQIGAHRVPKPHVTWNLWGANYTNSSDSDNVIAVYQGVSFLERDFPEPSPTPGEVIEVLSGEDFSNFVDENGYALEDIKLTNDTLKVFLFIPKGTRILNDSRKPLTKITIDPSEIQPNHSNLILAGEMLYQLEPDGAVFDPYIIIDLPFNTSNTGTPMIYSYNTTNTTWVNLNGTVSGDRISNHLTQFSIYGVFVKAKDASLEISLNATIRPAISIEVTPGKLDFGKLAPGDTSERSDFTIKNYGTCDVYITTDVVEEENIYKQGLVIDRNSFESFNITIVKKMSKTPHVALHVPENYKGVGNKTGTLIFWAEGVN
jgi:hypothetical protein